MQSKFAEVLIQNADVIGVGCMVGIFFLFCILATLPLTFKKFRNCVLEAMESQREVELKLKKPRDGTSVIQGLVVKYDKIDFSESFVFLRIAKENKAMQMRIHFDEVVSIRYVSRKIKIV